MKNIVLAFSLFFFISLTNAVAQSVYPCAFNHYMDIRYQEDPSLIEMREEYEEEIQSIINSRSIFTSKTIFC